MQSLLFVVSRESFVVSRFAMYIEEIEKSTGVVFKNKELLTQALMHRSFVVEHKLGDLASNERLEFLGDAVLELAITEYFYNTFTTQPEGVLTQWRSIAVNTKNLADAARKLRIEEYIFLSKGEKIAGGFKKERILANVLEALIGSCYLDQGYEKTKKFIGNAILSIIPDLLKAYREYNPKGILQEKIQAQKKVTPEYRILEESGPDHSKTFLAGIFLEGKMIGKGKGVSKKEAEEEAARDALHNLSV
ncbi:MAG: ribonuclease III [Candidatus Portnoybacteria bacterium]|nr:ribonuclease III [Candidatus Portnoybacteria bacterium]